MFSQNQLFCIKSIILMGCLWCFFGGFFNVLSHRQDSTYHSLCYTSHGAQEEGEIAWNPGTQNRTLIVLFITHQARCHFFKSRSSLKYFTTPEKNKVLINDDLTTLKHQMYMENVHMYWAGKLHHIWTSDGKPFHEGERKHQTHACTK